ncbi:MAG TPA: hypothetical protein DCZ92_04920 [Elusimicrobia bacterium]|nr:MAG: hypothetical protein A2016_07455 [Elusimicrobia bacterium GWF2_62_30]HBA60149.1 hypothetical protein [Elusimicrobiota bacterium]
MRNKIINSAAVLALLFFAARPACAQDTSSVVRPGFTKDDLARAKANPRYYTLDTASVKTTLLGIEEEPDMKYVKLQEKPSDLNAVIVSLDSILNIAQKAWAIIQANSPVANIETKYATAYPAGITAASQLSSWSKPKAYIYGFQAKNGYGSVMVNSQYKVIFTYGGSYKGIGKYLTGVTVIPTATSVSSGYKFNMTASVPDSTIVNVGTDSNPQAALQLKLAWKITTVLKESDGNSMYYMQGDGLFEEMASPFSKAEVKLEDMKSAAPLLLDPAKVFDVPAR